MLNETTYEVLALELGAAKERIAYWENVVKDLSGIIGARDKCIAELKAENEELREDFVDFACSGVPNLAPYCKNKTDQCVDGRDWCGNTPGACKGFLPKAWRGEMEAHDA